MAKRTIERKKLGRPKKPPEPEPPPLSAEESLKKKLIAGRVDLLTAEERKLAEELGVGGGEGLDPLDKAKLRKLDLEYDLKVGTVMLREDAKAIWTTATEKLMTVLERHLPRADYNAIIKDLKREWDSMGDELSFELPTTKDGPRPTDMGGRSA